MFGSSPDVPQVSALTAYLRNFCAITPGPAADAAGLMRSTMTQPGPYFSLDAPFVSIIGLYTNVLEGPGVISSQGGAYPVSDDQLNFLTAELTRLSEYTLEKEPIVNFGYLTLTVDVGSSPRTLAISFACRDPSVADSVTVNLDTGQLMNPGGG